MQAELVVGLQERNHPSVFAVSGILGTEVVAPILSQTLWLHQLLKLDLPAYPQKPISCYRMSLKD
jgi:hypothetical protein